MHARRAPVGTIGVILLAGCQPLTVERRRPTARIIVAGVHNLLLGLLVLDCLQILVALVAVDRSRRSRRAAAPSHARYAREHAVLLLGGAIVLLVPIALGLAGVIAYSSAVYAALALELIAFPLARTLLRRSEAAHLARRPA
jgi:hypothetical protein